MKKINIDWAITKKLIDSGHTREEIAKHFNVSLSTIKRHLKNNDFQFCDSGKDWRRFLENNHDKVISLYKNRFNTQDVARYFNCHYSRVVDYFKYIGYDYKSNNMDLVPVEVIEEYRSGTSAEELSQKYGFSSPKIKKFLTENGINIRDKIDLLKQRNASDEFQRKCLAGSWRKKEYTLPSGVVIYLRGYEPDFLDYIFENNLYLETDIDYSPPRIPYIYKNKQHFYYPDFYISKENSIIEIKSSWILKKQGIQKNKAKKQGVLDSGFKYKLYLDNDFTRPNSFHFSTFCNDWN